MASSTGIVIATGGIVLANRVVFNGQEMDWRIPIATGLAAGMFALAETMIGSEVPRAVALLALVAVTLTRVDPSVPSPAESALTWYNERR